MEGDKIIGEIISRYVFFAENRILPSDILFNYSAVRDKISNQITKKAMIVYLISSIGNQIAITKDGEEINVKMAAVNLSTFFEDINVSAEDISVFLYSISKAKNSFSKNIHDLLFKISERYKRSYGNFFFNTSKEIQDSLKQARENNGNDA
jgi:uncharacterized membrane protein